MVTHPQGEMFSVFNTYFYVTGETSREDCLSKPPHANVYNQLVNARVARISLDSFELSEVYYDINEQELHRIQTATFIHKDTLLRTYERVKAG